VDYSRAVNQISAIHEQLAKAEVYRGYRPLPVALSGLCGLAAAALGPYAAVSGDPRRWLLYWTIVGLTSGAVAGGQTAFNYLFNDPVHDRRRTRRVVAQMGPALIAGAALSAVALAARPALAPYLPGLWATLFGLGVFASRPYLPRATGWVALYYLIAGVALLALAPDAPGGWTVGGTFGVGQLGTAVVLYSNVERTPHAEEEA
jgi:hypothetical protein